MAKNKISQVSLKVENPAKKAPQKKIKTKTSKPKTEKQAFQDKKKKFRGSKVWKAFRKTLKEERQLDELTLSKLTPRFNLHHICMKDETYFDITKPDHFATLNDMSHDNTHWFFNQFKKKGIGGIAFFKRVAMLQLKMAKLNLESEDYERLLNEMREAFPDICNEVESWS